MTDRVWDLILFVCVLGATARAHASVTTSLAKRSRAELAFASGALMGSSALLTLAMGRNWYGMLADAAPWPAVFVLLAGALAGVATALGCAAIVLVGLTLLPTWLGLGAPADWAASLLVAALLSQAMRALLPCRAGYRQVGFFACGVVLAGVSTLLRTWPVETPTSTEAWFASCATSGLGTLLGTSALVGAGQPGREERLSHFPRRVPSLQRSLAQHALILENAMEGIAFIADDGRLMQINPAFARLIGVPAADLIGNGWLSLAASSESAVLHAAWVRARQDGRAVVECVLETSTEPSPSSSPSFVKARSASVRMACTCSPATCASVKRRRASSTSHFTTP